MQHLSWEKSGRTFSHADEGKAKANQFTYKSSIGQQNVDLGDGKFAPYVWDKEKRIVKFADCELRFTASGLEFWHDTEKLNTLVFNPEYKDGAIWGKRLPSVGGLTIQEIDPGNSKVELKISYKLTTEDAETEIFVRTGYNHKVHFGTKFKALKPGIEQGIELQFAEKFVEVEEKNSKGEILPTIRLKTDKSWWSWDRKEQADHEIEQTTTTKIHLGRKVYALNEEKIISPDTWGTDVGIVANTDDGNENGTTWAVNGTYGNCEFIGDDSSDHGGPQNPGYRWDNITIAQASIINSTLIDIYHKHEAYGTNAPSIDVYACDEDDAAVFGGARRPSTVTKTTATVAWNNISIAAAGWRTSPDLSTITKEIVDRALWASGNAINYFGIEKNVDGDFGDFEDYNNSDTKEAELTITYTAGGGGLSIPVAMDNYRFRRN